jgi:hypothetical protein
MAHWAVVVSAERYAAERLFANESVPLPSGPAEEGGSADDAGPVPSPRTGDEVLLIGDGALFGLGRVGADGAVAYTHRLLDEPLPVSGLVDEPGVHPLTESAFAAWAGKIGSHLRVDADKRTWLVSVDLPIEAPSPAEAVRAFWSYVYDLGPHELPAFVAPSDDELAMQAFVLGVEANQDPEEDDQAG